MDDAIPHSFSVCTKRNVCERQIKNRRKHSLGLMILLLDARTVTWHSVNATIHYHISLSWCALSFLNHLLSLTRSFFFICSQPCRNRVVVRMCACAQDEATREVETSTRTNLLWVGNTNANTIQTIV